ncbi:3-hydroxyacyl-CoA dehydrogenase family protein [Enteractinococcus fodinae]|uniref:3-hydroxybutyryl-CoA dehydrogenase n=1 Tax=Enteractinococcus fodinae TaxID=684663 RepID=A0ABU2AYP1_9MICC|nr:3-hydroxyacyl-CoA dehydrogenase family protein [Enteractinococcus fodinae]MDR7345904.1 3-hydroxybutyryl-CoA dehydrogenase [Enteractinococcus fodinae]
MADTSLPSTVGVLGGGRMGAGIAHAFLTSGSQVVVVERDTESATAARDRILRDVSGSVERGKVDGTVDELAANLSVTTDHGDFATAGLVIEAVPEDFDLKVSSLQAVESHLGDDAYLATNTSSMSVNGLAEQLQRPQQFCGLHFFNPVPASKLVEVIIGEQTSDQLKALAAQWVEGIGKTAVTINDAPGFASSRLGVALGLEAIRMVEEGVASAEDIDNAMTLGYKHPIGPLALTDIVGLDVRLGVAEYLTDKLGPRFEPPQLMRDMVERGELGRKSGKGFYTYDD